MWRMLTCAIALVLGSACSNSDGTSEVVPDAQALAAAGAAASSDSLTTYGVTDFEATGSPEAYPVFLRGLLQLRNFEFEDAGALYALGILTTSHNGREFDKYMRAGAITEEILDRNPLHPGALHYNIHSYDDPIHAPLGLRSARVYSDVAVDAIRAGA